MRSVLLWKDMDQVAEQMDAAVFQYVGELQTESFEAFADFDLLAFDWYDVRKAGKSGKVLVYIDREDLFFFCRNEAAQQYVQGAVDTLTAGGPLNDQQLLYRFFAGLFKGDMAYLEKLEAQINGGESTILEGKAKDDAPRRIAAWRRELLHLKRYYEQLDAIFDEMCDNDNGLIEANILARLEVLGRRTGRYLQKVCALQELVAQLREAYQSQLAIQQNDLMRVFTIVTVLFLPLTLIRKEIKSTYIKSFLYYVPYVTLAAMTFPAILSATANIWSALAGFIIAVFLAYRGKSLLKVSLFACLGVFIVELITGL